MPALLRVLEEGADGVTFGVEPTLDHVSLLAEAVQTFAGARTAALAESHRVSLAVDEWVTNVVQYGINEEAPADIRVSIRMRDRLLRVVIENRGAPFDPFTEAPLPDTTLPLEDRPIGGLGVLLVQSLMSSVRYERVGDRNQITLTRSLEADEAENGAPGTRKPTATGEKTEQESTP